MRVMDLVMMAVVLWTLVGVAGTAIALVRRERAGFGEGCFGSAEFGWRISLC